jgi:hypothetical protein
MESFDSSAALIAQFLSFNTATLEVKTKLGNEDEYLGSMEANLGINQGWVVDEEKEGQNRVTLEGVCEALHQTLCDRPDDMDNALRDGPSCGLDFTFSTGNSTMNNDGTARGPARMERALKNITLINKNSELTKELATHNDHVAALLEANQALEERLCCITVGKTDEPADDMVLEIRGGGDQFPTSVFIFMLSLSTSDAEADEMVVALKGGCSNGTFLDDYSTSKALKKSYGLSQGSGSSPHQFMQVTDFFLGHRGYVNEAKPLLQRACHPPMKQLMWLSGRLTL